MLKTFNTRKRNLMLEKEKVSFVLVFPTLGPIYLKALRYQAKIFDLAVFNITSPSGKFKSVAVCHKNHLCKKSEQFKEGAEAMSEVSVSRRKRPERQLYVPPAQRRSQLCTKKQTIDTKNCCKSKETNNNSNGPLSLEKSDVKSVYFSLSDTVNLLYSFYLYPSDNTNVVANHQNCEFKRFLLFKRLHNSYELNKPILIYNVNVLNSYHWQLNRFRYSVNFGSNNTRSYPDFDLTSTNTDEVKLMPILVGDLINDFNNCIVRLSESESNYYKIVCDKIYCDESPNILDLSALELGHYFIISDEESDYLYMCQQQHEVFGCWENTKKELESKMPGKKKRTTRKDSFNSKMSCINENKNNAETENKNLIKKNNENSKKTSNENEHEQEKEIMRKTKENINRKTRPIMKYVDDANDTLTIDKSDSINNWEDLFNDNGEIQEDLLGEIIEKVGTDITVVKASEDYTSYAYETKPPEDLEHIVELYNFPPTLETHDIVQAFSGIPGIDSDSMYVKWVDDTHALLVLGSSSQAQKALNMSSALIKIRPMTAASSVSMTVAAKSDLRPAMKRPQTNLQTARRLITSHLGTKTKITKEQKAMEEQALKSAREKRRLIKQNEKDAWEGNLRSSVN